MWHRRKEKKLKTKLSRFKNHILYRSNNFKKSENKNLAFGVKTKAV